MLCTGPLRARGAPYGAAVGEAIRQGNEVDRVRALEGDPAVFEVCPQPGYNARLPLS